MSYCRFVPRALNLLSRGTTTLSTGSAASGYPLTYLYDGKPSVPLVLAAAGNFTVDVDGDLLKGYGACETFSGGVATGWSNGSTGTGALAQGTGAGFFHGGASSQKLTSGASGVARAYRDTLVRAGEVLTWDTVWMKTDGVATVAMRLQDLSTGKWWTGSAWSASVTDITTHNTTTWTDKTPGTAVTVDTAINLRAGVTTLRLSFVVDSSTAAGSGYFDDVALFPSVDFAGAFGHNIPLGATVTLQSSTSSGWGAPTTEATLSVYQPSFYSLLSAPVARRYWRFRVVDTIADAARYLGELVISSAVTLTRAPDYPIRAPRSWRTGRAETMLGHPHVAQRASQPTRALEVTWGTSTAAEWREVRDSIFLAAAGDFRDIVLIPRDDDAETCIFGRIDPTIAEDQVILDYRGGYGLRIAEHPFPVVGL
jgi:hypothetical protein